MHRLILLAVLALGLFTADAAAYYSPHLGRWITRDPAGYVDGGNLYGYVKGVPNSASDATGLCMCPRQTISERPKNAFDATLDAAGAGSLSRALQSGKTIRAGIIHSDSARDLQEDALDELGCMAAALGIGLSDAILARSIILEMKANGEIGLTTSPIAHIHANNHLYEHTTNLISSETRSWWMVRARYDVIGGIPGGAGGIPAEWVQRHRRGVGRLSSLNAQYRASAWASRQFGGLSQIASRLSPLFTAVKMLEAYEYCSSQRLCAQGR